MVAPPSLLGALNVTDKAEFPAVTPVIVGALATVPEQLPEEVTVEVALDVAVVLPIAFTFVTAIRIVEPARSLARQSVFDVAPAMFEVTPLTVFVH